MMHRAAGDGAAQDPHHGGLQRAHPRPSAGHGEGAKTLL